MVYDVESMRAYGRACAEAARKATTESMFSLGLVRRWMGVNALDVSTLRDAVSRELVKLEATLATGHNEQKEAPSEVQI
jgi:hypothetical protein